jgi:hypothetical protein
MFVTLGFVKILLTVVIVDFLYVLSAGQFRVARLQFLILQVEYLIRQFVIVGRVGGLGLNFSISPSKGLEAAD